MTNKTQNASTKRTVGEYSNVAKSQYAIDRKHSFDCSSQFGAQEYVVQLYKDGEEACGAFLDLEDQECDCGENGDMKRGEFRYFNGPIENYKGGCPEDIRKHVLQDYKRMESLNRGGARIVKV